MNSPDNELALKNFVTEFDSKLFDTLSKSSNRVFFYYANIKTFTAKWSKSAVEYFGLPGEILQPASIWDQKIHPDDVGDYLLHFDELLKGITPYHNCEYRITNAEGNYVWVNCRGYMTYDENGQPEFFAGYVTNMGMVKKIDSVTGLWAEYGFRSDISAMLDKGQSGAVMMINICAFKKINLHYGYDFGDLVLYTIGQKMCSICGDKRVYRLDGAQFGVIIDGGREKVLEITKKIYDNLCDINIGGYDLYFEFSCGALLLPQDGEFLDQVQNNLSDALTTAKQSGSNEVVFYSHSLFEQRNKRIKMMELLRKNVRNNFEGFRIVMQPIVDAETGKLHSAEVLLRWSNSEFETVGPMDFVPILEETRDIITVGRWIIDTAFKYVAEWNKVNKENTLKHVNINFSYIQFTDPLLFDFVIRKLEEYELPHDTLIAELTESCRVEYTDKLAELLQRFRDEGVIIALDDFGTGYASLAVLKDIPADIVKIDHSMTKTISERQKDRNLVEFIITYCNKMNIQVCTEGIENTETLEIVKSANASYIQGYYYDKPLEMDEFSKKYINK